MIICLQEKLFRALDLLLAIPSTKEVNLLRQEIFPLSLMLDDDAIWDYFFATNRFTGVEPPEEQIVGSYNADQFARYMIELFTKLTPKYLNVALRYKCHLEKDVNFLNRVEDLLYSNEVKMSELFDFFALFKEETSQSVVTSSGLLKLICEFEEGPLDERQKSFNEATLKRVERPLDEHIAAIASGQGTYEVLVRALFSSEILKKVVTKPFGEDMTKFVRGLGF